MVAGIAAAGRERGSRQLGHCTAAAQEESGAAEQTDLEDMLLVVALAVRRHRGRRSCREVTVVRHRRAQALEAVLLQAADHTHGETLVGQGWQRVVHQLPCGASGRSGEGCSFGPIVSC